MPDLYELDPLCDSRWKILVSNHPLSSVFHSTPWLTALKKTYGYRPVVITSCSPEAELTNGMVFCDVSTWLSGRRLISLPFSDHCEPLLDSSLSVEDVLSWITDGPYREMFTHVELRPCLYRPPETTNLQENPLFVLHRLDLRPTMEDLHKAFHKDCIQRKLRRAERENLQYEEGSSIDLLRKFYQLLVMTRRRHGLPPQPLHWFQSLIDAFGSDLKIRVASKDGQAVASILTTTHNQTMVYKYGASDAAASRFGGTCLLFWKTIQEAKAAGLEFLDMGRSELEQTGLITFKERWGAVRYPLSYWGFPDKPRRQFGANLTSLANRVVLACPDVALKAIGEVLYRHIG